MGVYFLCVCACTHTSLCWQSLSLGNGAIHLAMGMYNRRAHNLRLSLTDMTLPILICFFLFAKMWTENGVPVRCRKESFLLMSSSEKKWWHVSITKICISFKTQNDIWQRIFRNSWKTTFEQGPLNSLLINPFTYYQSVSCCL